MKRILIFLNNDVTTENDTLDQKHHYDRRCEMNGNLPIDEYVESRMNVVHDDEPNCGTGYCTRLSTSIDQIPLPFIPGLAVQKQADELKKCVVPEHFHRNVSLTLMILLRNIN